jgi:hypothetical protein
LEWLVGLGGADAGALCDPGGRGVTGECGRGVGMIEVRAV